SWAVTPGLAAQWTPAAVVQVVVEVVAGPAPSPGFGQVEGAGAAPGQPVDAAFGEGGEDGGVGVRHGRVHAVLADVVQVDVDVDVGVVGHPRGLVGHCRLEQPFVAGRELGVGVLVGGDVNEDFHEELGSLHLLLGGGLTGVRGDVVGGGERKSGVEGGRGGDGGGRA